MTRPLLDFSLSDPPQVWLIVFLDPPVAGRGAPWSSRLLSRLLGALQPGFRHVFAVSPVDADGWLVCNPGSGALAVGIQRGSHVPERIRQGVASGHARCIAMVGTRPDRWQPRVLLTCSNVIAHLAGIPAHPFLTPRGLWRRLVAMRD